jgi:hypothetical protein
MSDNNSTDYTNSSKLILNKSIVFLYLVDPAIYETIIIIGVLTLVLFQFLVAICSKFCKKINIFIRSYNRILTNMISDSVYELQFLQVIACFYFLNVSFVYEASKCFDALRSVIYIKKLVYIYRHD